VRTILGAAAHLIIIAIATMVAPGAANAQCCANNVNVVINEDGEILVLWCVIDTTGPDDSFRVVREANHRTAIIADALGGDVRHVVDTHPVYATTNSYTVYRRAAGETEWKRIANPGWLCAPARIARFEAHCGEVGVDLSWALDGPHAILAFRVMRKIEGDADWTPAHDGYLSASARTYRDRSACPGVRHDYALELLSPDLGPLTGWEAAATPTASLTLQQNYPNPFNPTTTIGFSVASLAPVSIVIYDVSGHRVRELYNATPPGIGYHEVQWDGGTDSGGTAGSGVYFYRMTAPGLDETRRMVMVR
jgi:hypothetical protein